MTTTKLMGRSATVLGITAAALIASACTTGEDEVPSTTTGGTPPGGGGTQTGQGLGGSHGTGGAQASGGGSSTSTGTTSGSGGTGQTSGSGGQGQGGGTAPPCDLSSDCPPTGSECVVAACSGHKCVTINAPEGTVLNQQQGTCQKTVCDSNGGVVSIEDDTNIPNDGICMVGSCKNGSPVQTPLPKGAFCYAVSGTLCDGLGKCVQCLAGPDCPSGVCINNHCAAGVQ